MAFEIVGRKEDLASVRAFLGRPEGGPAAFVLEGEAGIGKSTVWLAAVDVARELGLRVLLSRPTEAERGLAHAGLGDLFDAVVDDVVQELSIPRRRALELALLRDEVPEGPIDHRALGVAVRDVLHLLGERAPVVIAVDDVQWLDASSSSTLAFALRRLGASPMLLLLARRLVDGAESSALEQALEGDRVQRLSLEPLSVGAVHRLLHDRLGKTFARQTLLRIHERSGGNPFFALELARTLEVDVDPTQPFPVPQRLEELVRSRIASLPERTREALALAAALGTPSTSLLARTGVDVQALDPAFEAHVIERDDGAIRFTHPLLSSVLYADLGDGRRDVHGRLANVVDDPLVRARHLALATEKPDTNVAAVLDDAVRIAGDRGATALAAELADHAFRLTGAGARHRRALAAARAHIAAGEWTRARALATELLAELKHGPERAEVLVLLAEFEVDELAAPLLEEALPEADAKLQLKIRISLALSRRFTRGWAAAFDDVRAVLPAADDLGDDELLVLALNVAGFLGRAVGDPDASDYAARAREIARASGVPELLKQSAAELGQILIDRGEHEAARATLDEEYAEWRERDEWVAAGVLHNRARAELWMGNLERAADDAARGHETRVQYGAERHSDPIPGMWVAAYRGQFELSRTLARRGLELCHEQLGVAGPYFPGVLGLVAFWSGDNPSALEQFAEADRLAASVDWHEPTMRRWTGDYVEALLEVGRINDAMCVLDRWEADAVRLGRAWVLAQVARCRGLVAAARGNVDEAVVLLEQTVVHHEQVSDPFGRARTLLALGVMQRRKRQKRVARDAIGATLAEFERLGAASWVEKAQAELGRIGGRTREEGLTPAERRVAALVAEGRTNKEVAAALFLAERTVETHLSHVYAKLGVRSRAQLAREFRDAEQTSGGLTISS